MRAACLFLSIKAWLTTVRVLILCCGLACAASAQVIVGFNATRGGSYNLQSQPGVQTAISAALPGATYTFTAALDSGALTGARGVVIMAPVDNINPISALTASEQAALLAFIQSGGFAIIATDAGYIPAFDVTNASFVGQFGLTVTGTDYTGLTIPSPTGNPITNGPFGVVSSLSGIAAGPYTTVPAVYNPLGQLTPGVQGAGYFARGALGARSGAVLFLSDANVLNSIWATPANYNLVSNFVSYAIVPEPSTLQLLLAGFGSAAGLALVRRLRGHQR
jgi:hypothetical protein